MPQLILKTSLPLAHFSLELDLVLQGRVTAVFGPSGAGKTSLLDFIAGLRRPRPALLRFDDTVLTDTSTGVFIPVRQRGIGYVPQDLALFPHLSVRQNLLYGHRHGGHPRLGFEHIVELLEIQPLLQRGVAELSGGEKQRVAVARALLTSPRLLLLDEPLASLDQSLKAKILPYFARIRDEFGIPMLYVTHDRFETLALADEMVVLAQGKVVQVGAVQEVFNRPANLSVAGILTVESIQPGRLVNVANDLVTVEVGSVILSGVEPNLPTGTRDVYVCIRAEHVILTKGADGPSSARNHLPATVRAITRAGPFMRIDLDCGFPLAALLTKQACEELALNVGIKVVALVKAPHVHLIRR